MLIMSSASKLSNELEIIESLPFQYVLIHSVISILTLAIVCIFSKGFFCISIFLNSSTAFMYGVGIPFANDSDLNDLIDELLFIFKHNEDVFMVSLDLFLYK